MKYAVPRTVLAQLIQDSDRSVAQWCAEFSRVAVELGEDATLTERQLHRWMAGGVNNPQPASQRVAQQVWKLAFKVLISPPRATGTVDTASTPARTHQEITMSTEDAAHWVKRGAGGVDQDVLDQLHADVAQLAADYLTAPALQLVPRLAAMRREVFDMLDARQRPKVLPDLYRVAGQVSALMAHACADLGRTYDAETHARTAWLAADYSEDPHLRAYVRWVQANVAYWDSDYARAAHYARSGLTEMRDDATRLRLSSQLARAEAARGDSRAALAALDIAADALTHVQPLTAAPGVMYFDPGKARYYAAEVYLSLGGTDHARLALTHADAALDIFTGESPREFVAAAELDAALAHLALRDLEAAAARVEGVLDLPAELRTSPIVSRVTAAANRFAALGAATRVDRELTERITLFRAYTAEKEHGSKE
ncbi:hypothetical protein ACTD5D_40645 [Nocardia takedensis]|uniref:hypothetical protein n=1 Tax=Nocardia takedensis TaxID=259390 RepID=UPI003F76C0B9